MDFPDEPRIVVVGLGYVGLPLAVTLAHHFATTGLDIHSRRVAELKRGHDRTGEIGDDTLPAPPRPPTPPPPPPASSPPPAPKTPAAPTSTSSPHRRRSTRPTGRTSIHS